MTGRSRRLWMPRCNACGPLGPAIGLETCISTCSIHHDTHPTHITTWVPIRTHTPQGKEQQ